MATQGDIFIVTGASGTGKTSLIKRLLARCPAIELSVSHTTRAARPDEQDGLDYHFIEKTDFLSMISRNEFAEWAVVHNAYYGTALREMENRRNAGIDVLLDVDTQGAESIRQRFPEAISIFILPPSAEVLKKRLVDRRTESREAIETRLRNACGEVGECRTFHYIIINEELEKAADELVAIIIASRRRLERTSGEIEKILESFERQS